MRRIRLVHRAVAILFVLAACLHPAIARGQAGIDPGSTLKHLGLDDLANLVVTSMSREATGRIGTDRGERLWTFGIGASHRLRQTARG